MLNLYNRTKKTKLSRLLFPLFISYFGIRSWKIFWLMASNDDGYLTIVTDDNIMRKDLARGIIEQINEGWTNKEIADVLEIEFKTLINRLKEQELI